MGYEFFIAKRYLKSKRKTAFISLITYFSIAGVMLGVAALIIVLSVMNGFEKEVRSRFIDMEAHLRMTTFHDQGLVPDPALLNQVENLPHVVAAAPYILDKGLITLKQGTEGLYIKGIDPDLSDRVTAIRKSLYYGEFNLNLATSKDGQQLPGIVLGYNLADKLYANIGDVVTVISPVGVTGIGNQIGIWKQFVVTGYFKTDLFEFDDVYAYLSLESAQKLYQMGNRISGVEFKLEEMNQAHGVAAQLNQLYPNQYRILTWFDLRRNLFSWMQIEKWAAFIILSLIIMVAAFNIISTLIMVVMEKTKDIGILKSMGASARGIRKIFVFEGLFAGIIGTLLGSLIGYALCWSQIQFKWFSLPGDIYIIHALPVLLKWTDFFFINLAAIGLCFLATVYPATLASRLQPVEAIRYE